MLFKKHDRKVVTYLSFEKLSNLGYKDDYFNEPSHNNMMERKVFNNFRMLLIKSIM